MEIRINGNSDQIQTNKNITKETVGLSPGDSN